MENTETGEENNEEKVAEDWCFHCKDGGLLLVCDHKDCHKAYHSECVGKDPLEPETGEPWICNWHRCFNCGGGPEFHCISCPKAVCKRCVKGVEFANFRAKKSFCGDCLKLLLLIEENVEVDSDGGKIDFKDRETYEGLFKEYWDLIKDEEGVTLEDLYTADRLLHKGKGNKKEGYKGNKREGCRKKIDSDKLFICDKEDELLSDFEENEEDLTLAIVPSNGIPHPALKSMKRKMKKKKVFIGWGSKPLIDFLTSVGKDPSQSFSLFDLVKIVNEYITNNRLTDREKKKRVICDERLLSLLGKRTVNRTKIRDLLEPHLRDNQDSSEEDELSDNSEEGEGASNSCKRQRRIGVDKDKTNGTVKIKLAPRSCFASIVTQNIKLVYLKRSLVQDLLKKLDTFDGKVVGSFVRVKSDPNDYLQKNSHQLLQVTGIQKVSEAGESNTEIILQLSSMSDGVQIRMLSDDDFTEEECEDLRQRVKDGQVKRPTTWDLEGKARVLHEDITYHWIERELALLQNLIDRANEKGWRRELCEYLERRTLLQSPSERERLIQEVPLVIADEIEVEPPVELPGDENPNTDDSPRSILSRDSESLDDVARKETSSSPKDGEIIPAGRGSKRKSITYAVVESNIIINEVQDGGNIAAGMSHDLKDGMSRNVVAKLDFTGNEVRNGGTVYGSVGEKVKASVSVNCTKLEVDVVEEEQKQSRSNDIEQQASIEDAKQRNNERNTLIMNKRQDKVDVMVIDLANEDGDACGNLILENPESSIWHYLDPSGKSQGPFSMSLLKMWKSKHFFTPDFKVWKTGQPKEAAILLTDAICQVYPENSR
ncbi:uncharacterized protein At5g08430-like isoform X2 [Papaver somniferum]|uniref:uncharacterized protein At5g08430-like isoform X2 n=1 Tax=Papaver somniferum TaxID=3469 RepID=UPI000E700416|nr:uncharacterized protein At5g08430-like isoform X2 [Papaver somniferum]